MRRSPLDPRLKQVPLVVSGREHAALWIDDLSGRDRFGCKGPGAAAWLSEAGYGVPSDANSVLVDASEVLVARLATSEFLVEALGESERVHQSKAQLDSLSGPSDVYPVPREDLVVGIRGPGLQTLLRQICSVDFSPWLESERRGGGTVVLTSMIGVSVVAWPRHTTSGPIVTLWLDPSFASYFWTTLLEVGRGVGAMVIGS
jgi:sarcosine oxidase subunit gamma